MKTAFQAAGEPLTFRDIIARLSIRRQRLPSGDFHPVNASVVQPTFGIREERSWAPMTSGDGAGIAYHRWDTLVITSEEDGPREVGRLITRYRDDLPTAPLEEREQYAAVGISFEASCDLRTANLVVRTLDWDWRAD